MKEFTEKDDTLIINMTQRGYTNKYIGKVLGCSSWEILKRQHLLRLKKRLT